MQATNTLRLSKNNTARYFLILPLVFTFLMLVTSIFLILMSYWSIPVHILGVQIDYRYTIFLLIGFTAQSIDGAIGLAYGLVTTTSLITMGFPPTLASGCVHISEVFTTGTSGFSHWRFGHVNKKLFKTLILPAIVGVVLGAYILTSLDGKTIKPFISMYLLIMGFVVIAKSQNLSKAVKRNNIFLPYLGFFGGFMDAIGGGGWGAIVTTTLLSQGRSPKYTIGTINFTEFFVTLASAGTFIALLSFEREHWIMIACIILGGIPASFFSAYLTHKLPAKTLMFLVGVVIIILSSINILALFR